MRCHRRHTEIAGPSPIRMKRPGKSLIRDLVFACAVGGSLCASGAHPAPPGTSGDAWRGSVPRYQEVYAAEAEKGSFKGDRVKDQGASGGEAIFFAVSKAYRPETQVSWTTPAVEPGFHRARLRIRARGRSDDGLVGSVEVSHPVAGEPLLASRPIHDFHHAGESSYFDVVVPFDVVRPEKVRVRIVHNGQTDLWVDRMVLERESSTPRLAASDPRDLADQRARISLNGWWQFQPVYGDLFFPPPGEWSPVPIRVPSAWNVNSFARAYEDQGDYYPDYPSEWENAKAAWYRLRFTLDEGEAGFDATGDVRRLSLPLAGRRVVVRFDAVAYSAEVYLNGTAAGYHEGGFTPFEVDVTDALRPGAENELLVGVRTWLQYHDRKKRRPLTAGSFWGEHIGGIWQNVSLESRPLVSIADVFIRTSVRRREISVTVEVENRDSRDHVVLIRPHLVRSVTDWQLAEGAVPRFESRRGQVPRFGRSIFEWTVGWPDPRFWSPEDPYLYSLAVGVTVVSGGGEAPVADCVARRFGFREIWIDGRRILLNGQRIKLRGDAWHFMGPPQMDPAYARAWYRLAREAQLNLVRLHAQPFPEFYLDLADEMGMLVVDETSWWASSGGYVYGDEFEENFGLELEEFIRRDRSHPSVIMWSLANELVAGHNFYSDDGIRDVSELAVLARRLTDEVKRLDPTRPVSSDGDEDLKGVMDVWSLHYPYADTEYTSEKPVMIGEACPMYFAGPLEMDNVGGEDVFRSFEARCNAVAETAYWQIRNYRRWAEQITPFNLVWYLLDPLPFVGKPLPGDFRSRAPGLPDRLRPYCSTLNPGWEEEIPSCVPNCMFSTVRDALAPRRFFLAKRGLRFYAPGRPEIPVLVFNDTAAEEAFAMRWELSAEGKSGTREIEIAIPAGEFRRVETNVPVPAVPGRRGGTLRLQLCAGDDVVFSASHPVNLYPYMDRWPDTPELAEKRIAVYTSSDDLLEGLGYLRIGFERIYDLAELEQISCDLLIVGRSMPRKKGALEALQKQLETGLRVLFMEGNGAWLEGMKLARIDPAPYERVFPCRWDHPLVRDMEPSMLEYWMAAVEDRSREDRIERIGEGALAPFQRGNLRPLLYIGGGRSVVAEGCQGSGQFLINQINVLRRLQDEPAALHFLQNLIRYAATAPQWEAAPAGIVCSATSRLDAFLRSIGVTGGTLESPRDPFLSGSKGVVLVDASVPDAEGWWPRIRRFVRQGGVAVLWGMVPETVNDWTEEVSVRPRLTASDSEQLVKSVVANGEPDPFLDGFRHATAYWVKGSLPSPIVDFVMRLGDESDATPLLEVPDFDWRTWEENPETTRTALALMEGRKQRDEPEYALVAVPMGEGTLYLSQLPVDLNEPRAVELARQLLTNLGVRLERAATAQQAAFNVDENGFIRSWLLCGPFQTETAGSLLDVDFLGDESDVEPVSGKAEQGDRAWNLYYAPEAALDFEVEQLYGWMDNAVAYAAVYVHSPRNYQALAARPGDERVDLLFGSDDGCEVWLNGEKVYGESMSRPLVPDNVRLEGLRFREGWNLLLFKVEDQVWKWGLIARLHDQNGRFPEGFLVSPVEFSVR
jgi:hypothetical protein